MDEANATFERLRAGDMPVLESLLILGLGVLAGLVAVVIVRLLLRLTLGRRMPALAASLRERCGQPLTWLLPLLGLHAALPHADALPAPELIRAITLTVVIVVFALLLVRLVGVLQQFLSGELDVDAADNLRARRLHTQLRILRQFINLVIVLLAVAAILLQFDGFRQFGRGLLASAGIASIVIGLAAQKTIGNLIAGFQIAITQPIRLDDVVVVEGEWGRIEEITLTYVVVRIWDQRRLILPISYFLEHPFTNWTRTSAEILGTVFLHVDYSAPFDALRAELQRAVDGHPDWDGRVVELVATEAEERTLELRALVSAPDSSAAWRLRCHVREALIRFLQREHPEALPKTRASLEDGGTANTGRSGSRSSA
ncbi:MAG: mechanosensitive ion channel [Enhygromyxa sp.]